MSYNNIILFVAVIVLFVASSAVAGNNKLRDAHYALVEKKYKLALSILNRELELRRKQYGKVHEKTGQIQARLADAYFTAGNYDMAITHGLEALAIAKKLNPRHAAIPPAHFLLSKSYEKKSDRLKSRTHAQLAEKTAVQIFGQGHYWTRLAKKRLARISGKRRGKTAMVLLRADAVIFCNAFNPAVGGKNPQEASAYLDRALKTQEFSHLAQKIMAHGYVAGIRKQIEVYIKTKWNCPHVASSR